MLFAGYDFDAFSPNFPRGPPPHTQPQGAIVDMPLSPVMPAQRVKRTSAANQWMSLDGFTLTSPDGGGRRAARARKFSHTQVTPGRDGTNGSRHALQQQQQQQQQQEHGNRSHLSGGMDASGSGYGGSGALDRSFDLNASWDKSNSSDYGPSSLGTGHIVPPSSRKKTVAMDSPDLSFTVEPVGACVTPLLLETPVPAPHSTSSPSAAAAASAAVPSPVGAVVGAAVPSDSGSVPSTPTGSRPGTSARGGQGAQAANSSDQGRGAVDASRGTRSVDSLSLSATTPPPHGAHASPATGAASFHVSEVSATLTPMMFDSTPHRDKQMPDDANNGASSSSSTSSPVIHSSLAPAPAFVPDASSPLSGSSTRRRTSGGNVSLNKSSHLDRVATIKGEEGVAVPPPRTPVKDADIVAVVKERDVSVAVVPSLVLAVDRVRLCSRCCGMCSTLQALRAQLKRVSSFIDSLKAWQASRLSKQRAAGDEHAEFTPLDDDALFASMPQLPFSSPVLNGSPASTLSNCVTPVAPPLLSLASPMTPGAYLDMVTELDTLRHKLGVIMDQKAELEANVFALIEQSQSQSLRSPMGMVPSSTSINTRTPASTMDQLGMCCSPSFLTASSSVHSHSSHVARCAPCMLERRVEQL